MKKIISLFVLIASLLSLITAAPVISAAEGTNVKEINDLSSLKNISKDLEGSYILTKDIVITGTTWTPIGTIEKPFAGSFDGNGHTITFNTKVTKRGEKGVVAGLFGCVSGSVKRLTVNGSLDVKAASANIGAVAAVLKQGGYLFSCVSNVNITADCANASSIGGIAGTVLATAPSVDGRIVRCINRGVIDAKVTNADAGDSSALSDGTHGAIGGILGFIANSAAASVNKCMNCGEIKVDGGQYNIGGIVGQTSTNGSSTIAEITECANKADITVFNLAGERAAGMIGYIKGGKIDYCYNLGNIIAYSDGGKRVSTNGYGTYFGIFGYANLGSGNRLSCQYCYSASENALEAEICTVRNTSYGTFRNYYLDGREEYETKLNSNAQAGKAGKSFKNSEDLTGKLVKDCDKYKSATDGNGNAVYPVLIWESENELVSDKPTAVYGSVRQYEESFDFRVIVCSDSVRSGDEIGITLIGEDGNVLSTKETKLDDSVNKMAVIYADNVPYIPASGKSIYALALTGMEYGSWSEMKVEIRSESGFASATFKYGDFIKGSAPVATGLGDLPEYPDGIVSNKYNAGPGLANDKNSVTPTDSYEVVISETKSSSYDAYIDTLKNSGYSEEYSSTIENNRYSLLVKDGKSYYIYFTANSKETRIILDNSSTKSINEIENDGNSATPEIFQYAIDFTKGTGQTSGRDYWEIDCGMFYIIKLADNSVFLIDGGHERQSSVSALEAINDFLHEITGTPDGEKVKISGWFFSHAHGDHVYLTHAFLEKYHDLYDLKCIYDNIPSYQTIPGGYDGGTFLMKDTVNKYYPDCDMVKLHTGEKFTLQGVDFEVLFTHEDAVNAVSGTTMISDFNATSTVIRTTINGKSVLFTGDISTVSENVMCSMFSGYTLRSDAVQLAHHCFNNLPSLYPAVGAPLILCPNSIENANGNDAKRKVAINAAGKDYQGILYAGLYTYKLTFGGDKIEYEQFRPIYHDGFYATYKSLLSKFDGVESAEHPLDSSVLEGMTDVSGLIYDKSGKGTSGTKADEAPQTLFDGSTSTKWCVTNANSCYVMWKTKQSVSVSAYQLWTANDTANHSERNPKSWTLWGSTDGENWVRLDSVYDGSMNTSNFTANTYLTDDDGEYQYFCLYVHSLKGGTTMQISEISIFSK